MRHSNFSYRTCNCKLDIHKARNVSFFKLWKIKCIFFFKFVIYVLVFKRSFTMIFWSVSTIIFFYKISNKPFCWIMNNRINFQIARKTNAQKIIFIAVVNIWKLVIKFKILFVLARHKNFKGMWTQIDYVKSRNWHIYHVKLKNNESYILNSLLTI